MAASAPGIAPVSEVSRRVLSVDIFRGLCVAGMVLVTNPGSWDFVYGPLKHAEWNGSTPTDMIFPSFLFLAGVAMTFSFASRRSRGLATAEIARHILVRSVGLIVLGVLLNLFDLLSVPDLRLPGVLQRIGLCYCVGGFVYLAVWRRDDRTRAIAIVATIVALGTAYWVLQTQVPVPGYGVGRLDSVGTLSAYLDRAVFTTRHLWHWGGPGQMWDPEGLLSTMPAIGNLLLGVLAGEWLRSGRDSRGKALGLVAAGVGMMLVSMALNPLIPINKKIWTPSFLLLSGGFSLFALGLLYWLIDSRGDAAQSRWRWIGTPAAVFGGNAILGFGLSYGLSAMLAKLRVPFPDGKFGAPSAFVFERLAGLTGPWNASLEYAILFVLFILLLLWPLHTRRIFLRL
jgi:predicted acyltransferase